MSRKRYTPEERAIHLIGALAGKSLREINDAVALGDAVKMVPPDRQKSLPRASLELLKRQYAAAWNVPGDGPAFWAALWDHCLGPKKLGDL